jgi:hypothetical protein
MNNARDLTLTQQPATPRRRFLGVIGALLGGLAASAMTRGLEPPVTPTRDLPLKEADFYRRHDLAG